MGELEIKIVLGYKVPESDFTLNGILRGLQEDQNTLMKDIVRTILSALEERAIQEYISRHPDRYYRHGHQPRSRKFITSFGPIHYRLAQLLDRQTGNIFPPLTERLSEILPTLLGCHQEFLLDLMGRRRPYGLKGQLEMTDDPVDNLMVFDERDDPHPNQFFYNRVKRGEPLYINTDIKLGGYGGEGYRNYLIHPWTPQQEKIWQIVADCVQTQVEESKSIPATTCWSQKRDLC